MYEQACRERAILPKFIRAVHDGCLGRELDLSGISLGDMQLEAVLCDSTLVPAGKVTRWRLRDTRISSQGVAALVKVLPWETEMINLSRNDLSGKGVKCLASKIDDGRLLRLRSVDLSSCGITCTGLDALARALLNCPFLLRLDLDHNAIADGAPLRDLVAEHSSLSRLSLNHNFLAGRSVATLFQGLLENARAGGQIADVGLAWNGFGKGGALIAAEAIAEVLAESVTLYHLDLSYNGLDATSCGVIGEGLKDNHHLYGLHLVGNRATMNADGFLEPLQCAGQAMPQEPDSLHGQVLTGDPRLFASNYLGCGQEPQRPTERRSFMRRSSNLCGGYGTAASAASASTALSEEDILRERDALEQRSTCWACEGWTRVELEWRSACGDEPPAAVWAFTSLDGFRSALRLQRCDDTTVPPPPPRRPGIGNGGGGGGGGARFAAARMVPGGCKLGVLFQVDGQICIAPGMAKEALGSPVDVRLRLCQELPGLLLPGGLRTVQATEIGVVSCPVISQHARDHMHGQRTVLVDGPDGCPVQRLRVTETEFRRQFTRLRSAAFFEGFSKENAKIVGGCLTEDWSKAKVGRIVQERDMPEVMEAFRKNYRNVIAIYRLTSTLGVAGGAAFGVNQIDLADLVGQALARHQFLEFLLRLADQRFVQSGEHGIAEALRRVLAALAEVSDARVAELDNFLDALHTEALDDIYRANRVNLQAAYKEFSGRGMKPGLGSYMSFSEFQDFLELADAYNAELTRQRAGFAFRLGMMTRCEETYSSRFQEMSFLEFQHALGAVVCLRGKFALGEGFAARVEDFFASGVVLALRSRGVAPARASAGGLPAAGSPH